MVCGSCGAAIAQVSGKSGGYYGCLAAAKGACQNKTLVRRTLAERVVLEAVADAPVQIELVGPATYRLACDSPADSNKALQPYVAEATLPARMPRRSFTRA